MTPDRWQQIDRIFHGPLERAPTERPGFVAKGSAGDDSLKDDVENLLPSHEQSDRFVETPAAKTSKPAAIKIGDHETTMNFKCQRGLTHSIHATEVTSNAAASPLIGVFRILEQKGATKLNELIFAGCQKKGCA